VARAVNIDTLVMTAAEHLGVYAEGAETFATPVPGLTLQTIAYPDVESAVRMAAACRVDGIAAYAHGSVVVILDNDVPLVEDPRTRLVEVTVRRREAREGLDVVWRQAIVAALAAGIGATETAELAGISRERVYQIRDGRR
jgi:hypothetical protein